MNTLSLRLFAVFSSMFALSLTTTAAYNNNSKRSMEDYMHGGLTRVWGDYRHASLTRVRRGA